MLRDLEVIIEKESLKPLVRCLGVVRKANRIMDCINRASGPKSKDVILLLYGLILSLYKELVGANQTVAAGLITLSSEAYCPGQGPVHRTAREDDTRFSKEGNRTRGVGFLLRYSVCLELQGKIM